MVKTNTLHHWLKVYQQYQEDITLCSRDTAKSWWANRVKFLDEDYNDCKFSHYNHRSVLDMEAVIEYDNPDKTFNLKLINEVEKLLDRDKIKYALFFSGGKSYHLHILFDPKNASRLQLLKKVILRYYGTMYVNAKGKVLNHEEYDKLDPEVQEEYIRHLPDLRLAENNHLVRAEYGLHEASGNHKSTTRRSPDFAASLSELPPHIWQDYSRKITTVIKREVSVGVGDVIDSPEVKLLLSTTNFKQYGDGKKRVLFILINLLKKTVYNPEGRYEKQDLVDFLWDWYKYVGGYELTKQSIVGMVGYYWSRDYSRMSIKYIREVLEELGVKNE